MFTKKERGKQRMRKVGEVREEAAELRFDGIIRDLRNTLEFSDCMNSCVEVVARF